MRTKKGEIVKCLNCGKEKYFQQSNFKFSACKFCSRDCMSIYKVGERSHSWKGGKTLDKRGYILLNRPKHPKNHNNYVYEHILVMEKKLGRYLTENEEIHHLNGKKDDNRIKNLFLCDNHGTHMKLEAGWKNIDGKWFKKCLNCKKELEVNVDNFYQRKIGKSVGKFISFCKNCCIYKKRKERAKNDKIKYPD